MNPDTLKILAATIIVFAIEIVAVVLFIRWRRQVERDQGFAYCGVCGDYARTCCSDFTEEDRDDPLFPRCHECCDHTHSPNERD